MIDKIVKTIPLITGILIFLGYVNLYTTYSTFGINIIEYINTGEILLSFFSYILVFVVCFILTVLSYLITFKSLPFYEELGSNSKSNIFFENKILQFIPLTFVAIATIIGFYIVYQLELNGKKLYDFKFIYLIESYTLSAVAYIYLTKFFIIKIDKAAINYFYLLLFIITIAILFFSSGYNIGVKSVEIKDGISRYNIEFQYKDKPIKTDKNFVYIGSSQTYLFMYDRKTKQTNIFKKDDLKDLKIAVKE